MRLFTGSGTDDPRSDDEEEEEECNSIDSDNQEKKPL